eukprot:6491886-Amphidinium_carterae.5
MKQKHLPQMDEDVAAYAALLFSVGFYVGFARAMLRPLVVLSIEKPRMNDCLGCDSGNHGGGQSLSSSLSLRAYKEPPLQVGVGVSGPQSGSCAIEISIALGFWPNFWAVVRHLLPGCAPWVDVAHLSRSLTVNARGIQQGDPLGPLLGLSLLCLRLAAALNRVTLASLTSLSTTLTTGLLRVRRLPSRRIAFISSCLVALGLSWNSSGSFTLLGASVGNAEAGSSLEGCANAELPTLLAALGCSKRFSDEIWAALSGLAESELDDFGWAQTQLSIAGGGLGLRDAAAHTSRLCGQRETDFSFVSADRLAIPSG